jgi:uncharacterized protein YukE
MSQYPESPDFTDAQYRAPIQSPETGGGSSGIEWLPTMPFAGNGRRVCNEADPSWEEVITMVVIPGHPEKIREASGSWEVLFRNIEQARGMVDQVTNTVSSWEGQTATAFKSHMTNLSQNMTTLVERHRPVVQHLNSSADNLQNALDNTPIPSDMVDDVMRARQNFGESGGLNVVHTGVIFDIMYPVFLGWAMSAVTSLFGIDDWVKRKLRDWISDGDDQAKAAYKSLAGQHVNTMDAMPKAGRLLTQDDEATTVTPTIPPSGSSPSGSPSISGGGGGGPQTTSLAGAGGLSGVGAGAGLSGVGQPGAGGLAGAGGLGGPNLNPSAALSSTSAGNAIRGGMAGMPMGGMPMGGMAGAGGAGGARSGAGGRVGGIPSSRTPGMGGMPMGGMAGGAGAGGRGAGTRGAGGVGGAGAGRAGAGGMPMGGMAGGAGAGGRGAGGRAGGAVPGVASGVAGGPGGGRGGAGAGARGAGMAGMGAGAGAGGDQATDHSTWLEEDEDVWGTDSDAAPPVLG